jgi:aminoglycoside N3'-acetyltransferase
MATSTIRTSSSFPPVPVWPAAEGRFDEALAQQRVIALKRMMRRDAEGRALDLAKRLEVWLRKDGLVDVEALTGLGPGEQPVVTACWRGRTAQEILIMASMGEADAGDNASGVAVALGIGRLLADAGRGGWLPDRGVRFLFTVEPRGLMALLRLQPKLFKRAVLGITLSLAEGEGKSSGDLLTIMPSPPPLPDPFLPILLQSLKAYPGIRWELGPAGGGAMGDPLLAIPTTRLVLASERSGQGKKGCPERPSTAAAGPIGCWLGDYIGYLCSAGPAEVGDMARVGARYARHRLIEVSGGTARATLGNISPSLRMSALRYQAGQERLRLRGLLRLTPEDGQPVWVEDAYPALPPVDARGLAPGVAARALVNRLAEGIVPPSGRGSATVAAEADRRVARLARRVPLKAFQGSLDTGALAPEVRRRLSRVTGEDLEREVPCWLQWALGWSNGKRTLRQISDFLRYEGCGVQSARLDRTFDLLAREGLIRWRPRLKAPDIDRVLRQVGVKPGMLLMTHTSLSAFGYVEGGALAVIDRLQAAVGPRGTLAMPTHTVSTFGQPVYDAARSPSTVGSITEVYRHQPGVQRSLHPTHSVAVRGPLAEALTSGHTGEMAPLAREGFWGRFVDRDGWVLMMAPIRKNTLMHAAELWGGVKLPGMVLAGRPGRRGAARVIPSGPWHNNWFDLAHERMRSLGQLVSAPLGEGTVYLMRGRDVVAAGIAVLRDDPLQVTKKNCRCEWCEIVRRRNGVPPAKQG